MDIAPFVRWMVAGVGVYRLFQMQERDLDLDQDGRAFTTTASSEPAANAIAGGVSPVCRLTSRVKL
jgi:hypothetical protein